MLPSASLLQQASHWPIEPQDNGQTAATGRRGAQHALVAWNNPRKNQFRRLQSALQAAVRFEVDAYHQKGEQFLKKPAFERRNCCGHLADTGRESSWTRNGSRGKAICGCSKRAACRRELIARQEQINVSFVDINTIFVPLVLNPAFFGFSNSVDPAFVPPDGPIAGSSNV